MAEVILLVLLVMTLLGMRMLLTQFGVMPRLPRLTRHFGLPALKLPVRHASARKRTRLQGSVELHPDRGVFAAGRSPFAAGPGVTSPTPAGEYEADDLDDLDEDDDDELPANQVDFFAEPAARQVQPNRQPSSADPAHAPDVTAAPESLLVPGTVSEPQHEADPDPNDIMSFFEKPPPSTTLPDTLRESMEEISASGLLEEARQILAMAKRGQASA